MTVRVITVCQIDRHGLDIFRVARVERHVRLEEHVVLVEIRCRDFRRANDVVRHVVLFHDLLDRCGVDRPPLIEQTLDRRFDGRLALPGSQVEDFQVLTARTGRSGAQQLVIGHAETDARKQIVSPTVVLESARFANEAVDHMPVVDSMFAFAMQTRQTLGTSLGVPDFKMLGIDTDRDLFADQPTRHAVGVLPNADRARIANLHLDGAEEGEYLGWQTAESFAFFLEPLTTAGVFLLEHAIEKRLVLSSTCEVAAAAKQQRLVDRRFQMAVEAFAIAVLVRASRVRLGRLDVVMQHQPAEPVGEITLRRKVFHRRTERIGSMTPRHTARLPHGPLESFGQTLERF